MLFKAKLQKAILGAPTSSAKNTGPVGNSPGDQGPLTIAHMIEEVIHHRGATLVRRLVLQPGEAMPWHVDPHHRVTVVLRGDLLRIEYKDGGEPEIIRVKAGQTDWDEPSDRPHRGVNGGSGPYEEITIFLLEGPGATPQPRA